MFFFFFLFLIFPLRKSAGMAGECVVPEGRDLEEMGEEDLWELINDNRHRISLGVRPCILIPYLRQARVLTEMDEDEIISCHNLTNRSMRTSKVFQPTFSGKPVVKISDGSIQFVLHLFLCCYVHWCLQ